ncbi:hypothetical protein ACF0H5_002678 [Mactra antiquata]
MAENSNTRKESGVLSIEDVDNESAPVEVKTIVHKTSEESMVEKPACDINDMPNVVQTNDTDEEEGNTSVITSTKENLDGQSELTPRSDSLNTPSKSSVILTNRSVASTVVSNAELNQTHDSYSTLNNLEIKSEISRKLSPLERLRAGIPKLNIENESVKTSENLSLKDVTSDDNVSKDLTRCESSLSRAQTRMSHRSIDAKIPYTTLNVPEDDKKEVVSPEDSWIRLAIPYLPLWLAILCLLLNICIPGFGTMISGFCIFCCATSRVPAKYDQEPILLLCVNIWVGLAQLFTVTFMLVGWFWSVAWGIRMIFLALERREELRLQRVREIQERTVQVFTNKIGW